MHNPPINLDYQPPTAPSNVAGKNYLIALLISFYLTYILIMVILVLVVPKFEQIFMDFNLKLSAASIGVLTAGDLCRRYYLWAVLTPAPTLLAFANYKIVNLTGQRWMRMATFVILIAFVIFVVVSLFLPMIDLIQGITTQTGKK